MIAYNLNLDAPKSILETEKTLKTLGKYIKKSQKTQKTQKTPPPKKKKHWAGFFLTGFFPTLRAGACVVSRVAAGTAGQSADA
jgi:hypothetical protein